MNVEKMNELILTEAALINRIIHSDDAINRCVLGLEANCILKEMVLELEDKLSCKDVDVPDFIKERMGQK